MEMVDIDLSYQTGLYNHGPKDYLSRRGGDSIFDVDAKVAGVKQILHGQ
jgi:hypothetical protein